MNKEEIKAVEEDKEGLATYEFLVNHLDELTDDQLTEIIDKLADIDHAGQYLASGIMYMNGVDKERFSKHIERMTAMTIDRDREHKYISDLIIRLYGADYYDHVPEFSSDDNFRRMYKRLFPNGVI